MTGVKTITKKALHHLASHRLVSMQKAVHMVDEQELVICSESMTYVSITQGQVLWDELEIDKKQDIITLYWNHKKNTKISLWSNSFTVSLSTPHSRNQKNGNSDDNNERDAVASNEHCILVSKGMNCIPRYLVDYDYARGMLILHKPWSKDNTLNSILIDHQKTINTFLFMMENKNVPSLVTFQYHTATHQQNLNTCQTGC
jgi:hypothetical protein